MSTISVDYDVLNQRGSPAWFTDTFANIPTAGYVGRMFISKDTFAFYRDTGTGWDLIGGPGIGTLTGSGVTGQVSFFNGTQVLTGSNNLFWDNINARLGIGTITPGQPLDIHSTGNTLVQLNNTATGNSNISFQNQDVAKWRVGNLYNAGANSFDIQNATTSTTILSINNSSNNITFGANISAGIYSISTYGLNMTANGSTNSGIFWTTTAGISIGSSAQTTIGPIGANGFGFWFGGSTKAFYFNGQNLTSQQSLIVPDATGTIALTSNLSAYLPLAGGTMTGPLILSNVASGGYGIQINNSLGAGFVALREPDDSYTLGMTSPTFTTITIHANNDPSYINTTGNFGFGNASPSYRVDITGTLRSTAASYLATSSGNVLIGTTTDAGYKLDVNGQGRFIGALTGAAATFSGIITSQVNGSIFGTASASGRSITLQCSSGGGGILFKNAANGDGTLSGKGTSTTFDYSFNTYSVGDAFYLYNNGNYDFAGSDVSDLRLKENIKIIDYNATEKLMQLVPKSYNMIKHPDIKRSGFIAQEVQQVLPNFISGEETENDYLGIDYNGLLALTIKAIQELNEKLVRNNIN